MMQNEETFTNKYRPVLLFGMMVIAVILLVAFFVMSIGNNTGSSTEVYDKISGTTVDLYQGETSSSKRIYAIESVSEGLSVNNYVWLRMQLENYVTVAFPEEQFSYKKNSLVQNEETGERGFQIASKNQVLTIRYYATDDSIEEYVIFDKNNAILYNYEFSHSS